MTALSYALLVLQEVPAFIQAGIAVEEFVTREIAKVKSMQTDNRDPTDAEWEELNSTIEKLRATRDAATKDIQA